MNRLSRIATVSALVGVAGVSQAFFFNSGINPGPPASRIAYGQVDSKFLVRKYLGAGADENAWWTPFVVNPSPEAYPNAWLGDDTQTGSNSGQGRSFVSRWISPFTITAGSPQARGSGLDQTVDGWYEFKYEFSLPSWEASWLNNKGGILGRWSSDNNSRAYWNGVQVSQLDGLSTFREWRNFNLGNINPGLNTLTFKVRNQALAASNPTGLRVEFTTDPAGIPPVPEPFTMALGAGALALAAARKRRKAKAKV